MVQFLRAILAAALLAMCAPALAQTVPSPRVPETLIALSPEEVAARMSGAQLYGCYIDGRERLGEDPQWGEHTADDGQLFDLLDDGRRVGRWYTVNEYVCYAYERARLETYCFSVSEADGHLYFTEAQSKETIATTDCRAPAVS